MDSDILLAFVRTRYVIVALSIEYVKSCWSLSLQLW